MNFENIAIVIVASVMIMNIFFVSINQADSGITIFDGNTSLNNSYQFEQLKKIFEDQSVQISNQNQSQTNCNSGDLVCLFGDIVSGGFNVVGTVSSTIIFGLFAFISFGITLIQLTTTTITAYPLIFDRIALLLGGGPFEIIFDGLSILVTFVIIFVVFNFFKSFAQIARGS